MERASLQPEYFEGIYERSGDPWDFATSEYERAKYQSTMESLPRARYSNAFEVGCSIGVLTALLASRCDHLLSVDVSDRALEHARRRCSDAPDVTFARMQVPQQMPEGAYDLIVVSEVAYYWQSSDLEKAVGELASRNMPEGNLILVHLTEAVSDYPLSGDAVHDYWTRRPEWRVIHHLRHERFRLDVLERTPA